MLRRVPVKGVVYSGLSEARGCVVVTALGAGAIVACLPTLAPIGIVNGF